MLSCRRACPEMACIEIGTSCMLSMRRRAVAVISSRTSLPVSAGALRSDVEAEMHHVALADEVFLAFEAQLPASFAPASPWWAMKSS